MSAPLLCFKAGGHHCCIVLAELLRVEENSPLLPVPYAHPGFSGFRLERENNSMFPVFDLWGWTDPRRVFEREPPKAIGVIESQMKLGPMGFLVDSMEGTLYQYEPSPKTSRPPPFPFALFEVRGEGSSYWLVDPAQLEQACQALGRD